MEFAFGRPGVHGWVVMVAEKEVASFLGALTGPFGLGGFDNKGVEERVIRGILVIAEPAGEEFEPLSFAFIRA